MINLIWKVLKSDYLGYLVPTFILLLIICGLYHLAYTAGYNSCNTEFLAYKQAQTAKVLELETQYNEQEKKYQTETQALVQQISKSTEDFNKQLTNLKQSYADKLQQSEQRANLYKQMSDGSNNSRNNLATHTARLDRIIVEGRQLVAELRATIELRDQQLNQCGEQLKLMENAYAGSGRE